MPHKYAQIEGVATYVYHQGPTTLPEEPPSQEAGEVVLCLHGEGGNGAQFGGLLPALAAAHSPLAFDQPGHHRSGELDSRSDVGRLATFTGAFVDKLSLRPHVVLGHAMGGAVAIRHALERASEVRALVLCSVGDLLPISDDYLETYRLISEGKRRREFNPKLYSKAASPDVMRRGFMDGIKTDPRATYGDLAACRAWDDRNRLAEITIPALVVRGAEELPEVAEAAARLAKTLPNATEVVIPDAGHLLPVEQPDALAAAILSFLEVLPR